LPVLYSSANCESRSPPGIRSGKQYEEHFVQDRGSDGSSVPASASDFGKKVGGVEFTPVS
jgi:hypothetical protein